MSLIDFYWKQNKDMYILLMLRMFRWGIRRLLLENDQHKTTFEIANAILFLHLRNISAELVDNIKFLDSCSVMHHIIKKSFRKQNVWVLWKEMFSICELAYIERKNI